jgi:formylglycine-generating enzyme required for sulfatase activity
MEQNTVFISYRRAISKHLARSIYMDLRSNGWDTFLDVNTIDSGDFDRIILNQIAARAHFILLISPGSLERCANAGDWVLREIQEAVRLERNIVPVVEEGADFSREVGYLPANLQAIIVKKNALPLTHFYFDYGVEILRTRFLKAPEYIRITETPLADRTEVQRRLAAVVTEAPPPPPSPLDEALIRARTFTGTRNRDWQPVTTTFPDSPIPELPFCLVPVGRFQMGSKDGHYDDETPVHEQRIPQPYWIAQHPVTNAEWRRAVQAGAVREPSDVRWYNDAAMKDCPVVNVDWFLARDFAQWMGCRLPTEAEWEYAARGVESWRYPWGNEWEDGKRVIWSETSGGKPNPISSKPEGVSWVGALHLIGNVWEWTGSLYSGYPYVASDGRERDTGDSTDVQRVLRGGSWGIVGTDLLRAANRDQFAPDVRDYYVGFRCARSS